LRSKVSANVDDVVDAVAHDQEDLANAVGSQARGAMAWVIEGARGPEVARLDDRQADRSMIGMKLRLPVCGRSTKWVVGDNDVRAVLPNEAGGCLGEILAGPGKLTVPEVQEGQSRDAEDRGGGSLLGLAHRGDALGRHRRIVVPLVTLRKQHRMDVVPFIDPQRYGPACHDVGIVGVAGATMVGPPLEGRVKR
jgi:hypothetical protein